MKQIFVVLIILFSVVQINAQIENINSGKYSLAKKHFETKYEEHQYPKYLKSQIKSYKDKVVIDIAKVLEFSEDIDYRSRLILENGLLDPIRINGKPFIKISSISELSLLNPDYKTKRFSFWVYKSKEFTKSGNVLKDTLTNRINPDEYYFELQNENADKNTSFEKFIEGAKLTYLSFG